MIHLRRQSSAQRKYTVLGGNHKGKEMFLEPSGSPTTDWPHKSACSKIHNKGESYINKKIEFVF